jgi:hypothetical protein
LEVHNTQNEALIPETNEMNIKKITENDDYSQSEDEPVLPQIPT